MFDPFEEALAGEGDADFGEAFLQVRARMQRRGFGNGGAGSGLPDLRGSETEEPRLGGMLRGRSGGRSGAGAHLKPDGGNRRDTFAMMVARRGSGFEERDEGFKQGRAGGGLSGNAGSISLLPSASGHSKRGFAVGGNVIPMTPLTRAGALAGGAQACVVKLVSTGGGRASAGAMIAYNSREGKEPIERETGELVLSRQDVSKMLDEWEPFFDKREPSKDVMTLTVRFGGTLSDSRRGVFKATVEEAYKEQRLVSGFGVDVEGHDVFKAVVSIASRGSGRIKTTDHARDMVEAKVLATVEASVQARVEGAQGLAIPKSVFALSEAAHGVEGLESHLKRALKVVPQLSGPKDRLIDGKAVSRDAAKWREDLRSYGSRDVMHLVISSKAGTDEKAFVNAARDFLGSEFGNHKYGFALHGPNDSAVDKKSGESKATDHVHIHAMIVMKGIDGKKLNPRIQDFKNWREHMAAHAQAHGINMVATSRTETLNAVNFTKGEHELVKGGLAPENIVAKIADKQAGKAVAPTRPSGMINAHIGKSVFTQLVANSRNEGNEVVALEAARMAKRIDAIFKNIDVQSDVLRQHDAFAGLIGSIQDVVMRLSAGVQNQSDKMSDKDNDMASRQAVEAAVERLAKTGAAISESLRGDPALKKAFDSKVMPQVIALKSLGEKSTAGHVGTDQDQAERDQSERNTGKAERSSTPHVSASETVQALDKRVLDNENLNRRARGAGAVSVPHEKSAVADDIRADASRLAGAPNAIRPDIDSIATAPETGRQAQGDERGSKATSKANEKPKGRRR